MWRDLERICAALGLPFVRPEVFPQNTLLGVAHRLAWRSSKAGARTSSAPSMRAEFGEGRDIGERERSPRSCASLGQDAGGISPRRSRTKSKPQCARSTEDAQRLGIFGAPSFVTADGELFWGNDRLEAALDWATR